MYAQPTPTFQVIEVTPEMATEWLGQNTHNRNLRVKTVKRYAADMAEGNWHFNGDPIQFGSDGRLLNGQHRLAAVRHSGVSIKMLVVFGLPAQAQETMDTGKSRSFADVLTLRGEVNTALLAAIVRRVTAWERGQRSMGSNVNPTVSQMSETLERYPYLREITKAAQVVGRQFGPGIYPALIGLMIWLLSAVDSDDAEFFFARLGDGQGLVEEDPIYALRRTIKSVELKTRSEYMTAALVIKAWNAYREGRKVKYIRFKPGGAKPETFPTPV